MVENCFFNPYVFVSKIVDLGIESLEESLTLNVAIKISFRTLTVDDGKLFL